MDGAQARNQRKKQMNMTRRWQLAFFFVVFCAGANVTELKAIASRTNGKFYRADLSSIRDVFNGLSYDL
jgi:hypothetical protein